VAAGSLLVNEAGGQVSDIFGSSHTLESHSLAASNGIIHQELIAALSGIDPIEK
jgi:myo-inositol-1(or 4)-monophosphatase